MTRNETTYQIREKHTKTQLSYPHLFALFVHRIHIIMFGLQSITNTISFSARSEITIRRARSIKSSSFKATKLSRERIQSSSSSSSIGQRSFISADIKEKKNDKKKKKNSIDDVSLIALTACTTMTIMSCPEAFAQQEDQLPSAIAAYGHYLGLLLIVGSLTAEKCLLKANLKGDELMKLVIADSVYGIAGILVLYTGYLRVTEYGKGWEFYSHEPIFWFKMFLFAVMGSSSLFVTIKTITAFAEKQKSTDPEQTYISEKLATRMGKVLNGELLAVLAIPLAATTMSRGVWFQQEMDWHLGAAPVAVASVGLGIKYVKEALTWTED